MTEQEAYTIWRAFERKPGHIYGAIPPEEYGGNMFGRGGFR